MRRTFHPFALPLWPWPHSLWLAHFAQTAQFCALRNAQIAQLREIYQVAQGIAPEISNSDAPSCSSGLGCHTSLSH